MSNRKRLTKREKSRRKRKADRRKDADPYTMNQDRDNQYPEHKYMIGDTSAFGEDVYPELPDDEGLGRNEIGLPNMPDWAYNHKGTQDWGGDAPYDNADTFTPGDRDREIDQADLAEVENYRHASQGNWYARRKQKSSGASNWYERGKSSSTSSNWYEERKRSRNRTANEEGEDIDRLERKAYHCVKIAESILGDGASEEEIEDQTFDLMPLPDRAVASTVNRLDVVAGDESHDDEMEEEMEEEMDEEETEAMIDDVLGEQGQEADQVVDEMTGESSEAPRSGDGMDIQLEPSMTTVNEAANPSKEDKQLRAMFEDEVPEGAREHVSENTSQKEAFSGRSQQTNQQSPQSQQDGVSTLGGPVKQASGDKETEELEKLWETDDDVSGAF
jgi:hypothetical protein